MIYKKEFSNFAKIYLRTHTSERGSGLKDAWEMAMEHQKKAESTFDETPGYCLRCRPQRFQLGFQPTP